MADTLETSGGEESPENADKRILAEAHARLALAQEAENEIRRLALEDLEFRSGKQWPDSIQTERDRDGRPCLVINRIPQFIQQITNDQRQNRPSIKVHPVDDSADMETAKVIQGMIRHIEYNSNADVAYDTAFDGAVTSGFGYFRIVTNYVSPLSFDQEILIKRVRNPFSVYFDPHSQEPDGSDAEFALIVEDLSKDAYKAKYPKSELASMGDWTSIGDQTGTWMHEGTTAQVAEYFYKTHQEETIVLLNTGETLLQRNLPEVMPAGIEIVKTRTTSVPVIKWCKLNGVEILEQTDWLGQWIPIVPVYGTELYIDGKRSLEGVVRNAKDSQRMYNYWASAETEAIALAPRAPYLVAEGQIQGYEEVWESANRKNHAFLPYKATTIAGQPVGAPQRNSFEPAVAAITNARMIAADDLKATTGIYDAALGNKSNETSGVAIQRRNSQAQTSNFHFVDNLTRSLRHAGRIIVDLMPYIYDTARASRIVQDNDEQKVVKLNQVTDEVGADGKPLIYDLSVGKYDVTVDVGPSFASKRQEAVASMLDLTKAYPQLVQVAGDLLVRNMDFPGAQDFAERLKKTMPPGLIDDPKQKQQPIPPQVQAQMQQMSQMVEQLTEQLNSAKGTLETKTLELESRERIEMAKLETQATIEMAKLESKEALQMLSHQIAELDQRTQLLGMQQPFGAADTHSPQPDGAMSAHVGAEEAIPTGGASPGSPMEGNFQ